MGIEGEHLLLEAVRSGVEIATVFFRSGDEALLGRIGLERKVDVIELPAEIFASAVTTESPQGIAALVMPKAFSLDDALSGESPLVVIAAGLQDPGNLGTLIRSAEAFGASGVIALPGTVSQWNAKAMRASSGSVFRLPVVAAGEDEVFSRLRSLGVRTFAAVAERGVFGGRISAHRAGGVADRERGAWAFAGIVGASGCADHDSLPWAGGVAECGDCGEHFAV